MKKMAVYFIIILVGAFVLFFLFTCIPKNIDINYHAIQYSETDPTIIKQTSIVMKGKLFNPLFFNAKYSGTCVIDGYDFTRDDKLNDITFKKYINLQVFVMARLSYSNIQNGISDKPFGGIWVSRNFDMISILIKGSDDRYEYIISGPAQTRDEAVQINAKYFDQINRPIR